LKLFLERFSINTAILNSELPHNSRAHILKQFDKSIFDFLIATDESLEKEIGQDKDNDEDEESNEEAEEEDSENENEERENEKKIK